MISDEQIYLAFPRQVGKIAAMKAIQKAVRELAKTMGEEMARNILYRAVVTYSNSPQGMRSDRQFIPHPATWFNAGRYLDDPAEWETGASPVFREPGIYRGPNIELTEQEIQQIRSRRIM